MNKIPYCLVCGKDIDYCECEHTVAALPDKPTQEQIKEFWEWCGFRHFVETKYSRSVEKWEYPKPYGVKRDRSYLPDIDLNNLFKYAVPKIREQLKDEYLGFSDLMIRWMSDILDSKDPTLALFRALDKVRRQDDSRTYTYSNFGRNKSSNLSLDACL